MSHAAIMGHIVLSLSFSLFPLLAHTHTHIHSHTHTHTHAHTHTHIHYVGCGLLNLDNGAVSYTNGLVVGSVATHTCNPGYQLLSQGRETRTCNRENGWTDQDIICALQKQKG